MEVRAEGGHRAGEGQHLVSDLEPPDHGPAFCLIYRDVAPKRSPWEGPARPVLQMSGTIPEGVRFVPRRGHSCRGSCKPSRSHGEAREALTLLTPARTPSSVTAPWMHFQSRSILSALHPHLYTYTRTHTQVFTRTHTCTHAPLLLQLPGAVPLPP